MYIDDAATSDYNDTKGYFWVRAVRTTLKALEQTC